MIINKPDIQKRVNCGKSKDGHLWEISREQKIVNEWIKDEGGITTMPLFNMGMIDPLPAPTHRCIKCNHVKGQNKYNLIEK